MITREEARSRLRDLVDINENFCRETVVKLNQVVLDNCEFFEAPGGSEQHHNYRHGLVQHTWEVMQNVLQMTVDREDPQEALVTAVIWHDFCKKYDYSMKNCYSESDREELPEGEFVEKMPYRKLIGHLAGSAISFALQVNQTGIGVEFRERVLHLLLSHHGRREWGSPVEPQTHEAYILHAADMMSAHGCNIP